MSLTNLSPPTPPQAAQGNQRNHWLWVVVLAHPAVVIQDAFLNYLCLDGAAQMQAALLADLAIVLRAVVALAMNDRSRWWRLYALLYPLLIPLTLTAAQLAGTH